MAKKTNVEINGKKYFRTSTTEGQPVNSKGKRTPIQFYGSSQKEADEKRDKYLEKLKRGGIGLSSMTSSMFGDLFDAWFHQVLKISISQSTIQKYEIIKRLRIEPAPFYYMEIEDINALIMQEYYNLIAKDSINKAKEMHKLLGAFYRYCEIQGFVLRNVMKGVVIQKKEESFDDEDLEEDLLFLSDHGQSKLFDALKADHTFFIFVFDLLLGLRQGELLALKHKHIVNGEVCIRGSLKKVKDIDTGITTLRVGKLKTKQSKRNLYIPDKLVPYLNAHIKREKQKHLKLGVPFTKDSYLFTTSYLTPIDASNLRRQWIATLDMINEPYIKFHALRHTFCSNLLKSGVSIKSASLLMGHSTTRLVDRVYSHFSPGDLSEDMQKMNMRISL